MDSLGMTGHSVWLQWMAVSDNSGARRASTAASPRYRVAAGRLRIDCLESTCSYMQFRGNKTGDSRKSRSLMDPSTQRWIGLRIVLRGSAGATSGVFY